MDATETPPAANAPAATTSYVILINEETSAVWAPLITISARSAGEAIRKAAEDTGAGTYVAIPKRSWQPTTVKVETKTTLKLEGA